MSDYGIIIEHDEHPDFRARIVLDDRGYPPEFEEGVPLYRIKRSHDFSGAYGSSLEHVYGRSSDIIERAWEHFTDAYGSHAASAQDATELLDRYLRIFHGGAAEVRWACDDHYVTAVTADIIADWGSDGPADVVVREASRDGEYFACFLDGDVYGIVVEQKLIETREIRNTAGQLIKTETRETWEQVDSVWGFYGDPSGDDYAGSYIRSEARDMIECADH